MLLEVAGWSGLRGSFRGRSCGRALAPCKSFMLYYKMFGVDRPNVCNDVSGL